MSDIVKQLRVSANHGDTSIDLVRLLDKAADLIEEQFRVADVMAKGRRGMMRTVGAVIGQTVSVAAYNPATGLSTYIPMVMDDDGVGGVKWVVPEDWGAPLLSLQTEDTPDLTVTVT